MLGVLFVSTDNSALCLKAEWMARVMLPPEVPVFSASLRSADKNPTLDAPWSQIKIAVALDEGEATAQALAAGVATETWNLSGTDELGEKIRGLSERFPIEPALGIIGGSGFYDLPGVDDLHEVSVETPFGSPSDHFLVGRLHGKRVVFLPRHARGHKLLPSEVNARANIYAMKRLGVTRLISVSAVGSLREEIEPGHVVLPRQFIDRTLMARNATFFGDGVVAHVSLADPICNGLADTLAASSEAESVRTHSAGTYLCMEGPQFSTRAESHMYRAWGCDIIGMTNVTEAKLAREAEICYATLAFPTDYDCWRSSTEEVDVAQIVAVLKSNVEKGRKIVTRTIAALDPAAPCACHRALDTALLTPPDAISPESRLRLHAILGKRSTSLPVAG